MYDKNEDKMSTLLTTSLSNSVTGFQCVDPFLVSVVTYVWKTNVPPTRHPVPSPTRGWDVCQTEVSSLKRKGLRTLRPPNHPLHHSDYTNTNKTQPGVLLTVLRSRSF